MTTAYYVTRRRALVSAICANPPPTVSQILDLWDRGHDTYWIGIYFGVHEAAICNALAKYERDEAKRADRVLGGAHG